LIVRNAREEKKGEKKEVRKSRRNIPVLNGRQMGDTWRKTSVFE
jgi:hypothetical protein